MLLTYLGVPCIYYGDEIGLGGDGTDTRACMPWDQAAWDNDLHEFYRTLIRLRRTSRALSEGGLQILAADEDTVAYLRDTDEEQIVVVAHRGPGMRPAKPLRVSHGAIPDGAELVEVLSGGRATVTGGHLPLPAMLPGVAIWRRTMNTPV